MSDQWDDDEAVSNFLGNATISFLGRDEDGLLLAEIVVLDSLISTFQEDPDYKWIELLLGPAGMVDARPTMPEPFRVVRVIGYPSGVSYTP